MPGTVCPWCLGYFLAHPVRRWVHDPAVLLGPFVSEGTTVSVPVKDQ